jgi:hypothetical protein
MDTVAIPKSEYEDLLEYKKIYDELENEMFYQEAKRISQLIREGKIKTIPAEEVIGKRVWSTQDYI